MKLTEMAQNTKKRYRETELELENVEVQLRTAEMELAQEKEKCAKLQKIVQDVYAIATSK